MMNTISVFGTSEQTGAYLLQISLPTTLSIVFGRYNSGHPVVLSAGTYLYVGSALGKGHHPLGQRVVRHTTRSKKQACHSIRPLLLNHLEAAGMGVPKKLLPKQDKHLHWHIDYLLDHLSTRIISISLYRTSQRLEPILAQALQSQPGITPAAPGLGASDHPGATHLLHIQGNPLETAHWAEILSNIL